MEHAAAARRQRRRRWASTTRCGPRWREAAQPPPEVRQLAHAVIRDPDEHTTFDERGAVRSIQAADLTLPGEELDSCGRRCTWSASRARTGSTSRASRSASSASPTRRRSAWSCSSRGRSCCCASARRSTTIDADARDRALAHPRRAARRARAATHGYLEIDVRRCPEEAPGQATHARRGGGRELLPGARLPVARWFYANTQSRIHVLVTHGFLRSLARLELEESAVGRFAGPDAGAAPDWPADRAAGGRHDPAPAPAPRRSRSATRRGRSSPRSARASRVGIVLVLRRR